MNAAEAPEGNRCLLDLSSSPSRRDFLRRTGGVAGAGLVHFTILGSLATPAYAETDDECATEGCDDKQNVDVCNCTANDTSIPPRDNCDCGAPGDNGTPAEDVCKCGDESIGGTQDVCTCGKETGEDCDYCTCGDDHNDFPSDACVPGGCYDSNWPPCGAGTLDFHTDHFASADVCECNGDALGHADACKCWWDGNPSADPNGQADYCDCNGDQGVADV